MITNMNLDTGIRYGLISTNTLADWWWDEVVYNGTEVTNLSHEAAFAEEFPELVGLDFEEWPEGATDRVDLWNDHVEIYEGIYEGKTDGVEWRIAYLGGAANLWVFKSPHTTRVRLCSPCVPNAGNLDSPDPDGFLCYDVPPEWRDND